MGNLRSQNIKINIQCGSTPVLFPPWHRYNVTRCPSCSGIVSAHWEDIF